MLHLDGSTLEGGGQLVRNAAAFSALLRQPIAVNNVRLNRPRPGLKPQHAAGLALLADICSATTSGIDLGSVALTFVPGPVRPGDYLADTRTAGATTLLLQVALPCLLFAPSEPSHPASSSLILRGGTNAIQAPQVDYSLHVLLPFLARHFRIPHIDLAVPRRGFFPTGGGDVRASIPHLLAPLPALSLLDRGPVTAVRGLAFVAGRLPHAHAAHMRDAAVATLTQSTPAHSEPTLDPALIRIDTAAFDGSSASGIVLWAETTTGCILAGSALGAKGRRSADVGVDAAAELARNLAHGGCVDEYLQDQIIIFLALAKGKSSIKTGPLTLHTRTAIWVAETMTDARFHTEEIESGHILLTCEGIGYRDSP